VKSSIALGRTYVRTNSLIALLSDRRGMVWSSLHFHAFRLQRELVRKYNLVSLSIYIYKDVQTKKKKISSLFAMPNAHIRCLSLSPKRFHRSINELERETKEGVVVFRASFNKICNVYQRETPKRELHFHTIFVWNNDIKNELKRERNCESYSLCIPIQYELERGTIKKELYFHSVS